jgi:hypothetical protein
MSREHTGAQFMRELARIEQVTYDKFKDELLIEMLQILRAWASRHGLDFQEAMTRSRQVEQSQRLSR